MAINIPLPYSIITPLSQYPWYPAPGKSWYIQTSSFLVFVNSLQSCLITEGIYSIRSLPACSNLDKWWWYTQQPCKQFKSMPSHRATFQCHVTSWRSLPHTNFPNWMDSKATCFCIPLGHCMWSAAL